jgi:hypothetical protein
MSMKLEEDMADLLARLDAIAKGTVKRAKTPKDHVSATGVIRQQTCVAYLLETLTPERVLADFMMDTAGIEEMFVRDAWEVMVRKSCLELFKENLSFWAGQPKQLAKRKPSPSRKVTYEIDTDIDHTTGWSMSQHD